MRDVLLVDIDGVLANPLHRARYAPDWTAFYDHISEDEPIQPMIDMVKLLALHYNVTIMTGRPEKTRHLTTAWLSKHLGLSTWGSLYMRENGDASSSSPWKLALCRDLRPKLVIDDEPEVAELLMDAGFIVLCPVWSHAFSEARDRLIRLIREDPAGY